MRYTRGGALQPYSLCLRLNVCTIIPFVQNTI